VTLVVDASVSCKWFVTEDGLPGLLDQLVPSAHLAMRALAIANELAHPAYDCFYLAAAELHAARMIIDDRRLLTRVVGSVWARRVIRLGDDLTEE
jgi:predicted nucleic acid-binding protein